MNGLMSTSTPDLSANKTNLYGWHRIINVIYYVVFAFFYNYHFLMTTMFFKEHLLPYAEKLYVHYDAFTNVLFVLTVLSILFLFEKPVDKIFPIIIFSSVLLFDYFRDIHTRRELAVFFMLIICSKNKSFKILGWLIYGMGWAWIIVSFIACINGYLTDIVYGGGTRHAFGSVYATDLACHFLTLIMVLCVLRKGKLKIYEYCFSLFLCAFNLLFMKAKVGFLCLFLVLLVTAYYQFITPVKSINPFWKKAVKCLGILSFGIFAILAFYLTINYSPDPNVLYNKLSVLDTISGRLRLGKEALDKYPIELWGKQIHERGNGATLAGTVTDYFFVDISYIRVLLFYGPVISSVLFIMFVKLQYRAIRRNDIYFLALTIIFAFDCFAMALI